MWARRLKCAASFAAFQWRERPITGENNLAIIFGVGAGLGGAISKRFAEDGHPVAMAARSPIP